MALGFGFGIPWRKGGGGGGKPPLLAQLRQWLVGSPDGLMEKDKLSIVRPEPVVVDVNCPSFNGVDAVINTEGLTIDIGEVYSISILANVLDDSEGMSYLALYASSYSLVEICSEVGQIYFAGGNFVFTVNTDSTPYVGTGWHKFTLEVNGSTMSGYVDDVLIGSTTIPTDPVIVDTIRIGNSVEGSFVFNGMLSQAVVTKDGKVLAEYPLQEGSGLPYDSSGNGNHATENTATWTTADGIPSAALRDGFSTGGVDISGDTITNGGFEAGETGWGYAGGSGGISGGVARIHSVGGAPANLTQADRIIVGADKRYKLEFDVTVEGTGDWFWHGMEEEKGVGDNLLLPKTVGHHIIYGYETGSNGKLLLSRSGACDITIDNVELYEVTYPAVQVPALIDGASEYNAYTQWLIDNATEPAGSYTTTQQYTAAGLMARTQMLIEGWTLTDGGYREHA